MTDEFGPRLRRERERRKISLASISANTKISISLFEALERDDVSRWPCGIFRRSFVRSYAEAIGLDGDEVVREFVERFPEPGDAARLELAGAPAAEVPQRTGPFGRTFEGLRPGRGPRPATLRLTLAESWTPFAGGAILSAIARRSAAVAVDATITALVSVALFLTLGSFWVPLTIFMACYYWGGILLLGNSPGVCLQGPADHQEPPGSDSPRRRFSLEAIRARFAAHSRAV
jgi:transcriptional regulator with XRE-family HTH domain